MPAAKRATPAAPKEPQFSSVAGKLAYVQTHVSKVQKGGTNTFHKFDYMKEANAIEVLRPLLEEVNAAIVWGVNPSVSILSSSDGSYPKTSKGKDQVFVAIIGSVDFVCGETGHTLRAAALGSAADQDDKAVAKAQTVAFKYGLQKLGLIPTDDIDDGDSGAPASEGEVAAPATSGAPPARADTSDPVIDEKTAKDLIDKLAEGVNAGRLDGNKVKAKLATFRVDAVRDLTLSQASGFWNWVEGELNKSAPVPG